MNSVLIVDLLLLVASIRGAASRIGGGSNHLLYNVTFSPPSSSPLHLITEDQELLVNFTYEMLPRALELDEEEEEDLHDMCHFRFRSSDADVARIVDVSKDESRCEQGSGWFRVRGEFLGHVLFVADVRQGNETEWRNLRTPCVDSDRKSCPVLYHVAVRRPFRPVDAVFNLALSGALALVSIAFGCTLDLAVVGEVLRRPVAPAIGAFGQFIVMPLVAYGLAAAASLPGYYRLGLFAMGCSPGGGNSNMWTLLLDGDVSLSITMTFLSSLLAMGLMPLWLLTLGDTLVVGGTVVIPFFNIFTTIAVLVGPVFLGILAKIFSPNCARKISKIMKPMVLILLLLSVTIGAYANLYILFLFDWEMLITSSFLPYIGFALAALISWLFRQPFYRIKTIAIETGVQSTPIALLVLRNSLPQPDADLASALPLAVTMVTPIPLLVILAVYTWWKRRRRKSGKEGYENIEGVVWWKKSKAERGVGNGFEVETLVGSVGMGESGGVEREERDGFAVVPNITSEAGRLLQEGITSEASRLLHEDITSEASRLLHEHMYTCEASRLLHEDITSEASRLSDHDITSEASRLITDQDITSEASRLTDQDITSEASRLTDQDITAAACRRQLTTDCEVGAMPKNKRASIAAERTAIAPVHMSESAGDGDASKNDRATSVIVDNASSS